MQYFWFGEHHILGIEHSEIANNKEYSLCFSGFHIKSKDKWILIYNKRNRRIIHLKEISEGMQVCYLQERGVKNIPFDVSMLVNALVLFQGFNEETWEKYHYLPSFSKDEKKWQEELKTFFWLEVSIKKEAQGTFLRWLDSTFSFPKTVEELLSFIFALVWIYWKFEEKNNEIMGIKVHVPLVWGVHIDEELEKKFQELVEQYWIFISSQRIQSWKKSIFQFQSNDRELLSLFIWWIKSYRDVLYTLDGYLKKQDEIKGELLEYIKTAEGIASAEQTHIMPHRVLTACIFLIRT